MAAFVMQHTLHFAIDLLALVEVTEAACFNEQFVETLIVPLGFILVTAAFSRDRKNEIRHWPRGPS